MTYPDFISNSQFYHLDHSKSSEEQLLGLTENIKKIYRLTGEEYESFDDLIETFLNVGIEIFQMQTGIVSHITENKDYIVQAVVTNMDEIHKGDVFELEGTYCREVHQSQKTLGFPSVGQIKELKSHPVYVNLKLEAYISAPIFVGSVLYGTLNFTSLIPREYGFSEHEHDLISMMAKAIGNFIVFKANEQELKDVNSRMKELVGHLAHDLRNPLGAILGLSDLAIHHKMKEEKVYEMMEGIRDEAKRSLELVNTILDEAAMGTGNIVLHKKYFNLHDLIEKSLKSFKFLIEERSLDVSQNLSADIKVFGDENRIRQLLTNLLGNAFKYAKHGSKIDIDAVKYDDKVSCEISNIKEETPSSLNDALYKSMGLGLDIVGEVLKQHGSQLKIEDTKLYKVSFELPLSEK